MSVNPNAPIIKIAVMADGRIVVDGSPSSIESLRASLKRFAEQKGVVWYYREAAQGEPPPQSAEVIQVVVENRLPVRLSSRPDYSDAIGMDGKPITDGSKEDKFEAVRGKAAQGQLVIVRPDGQYLVLPALRRDSVKAEMVAAVERMIPSTTKRNVAVIGDTTWAAGDAPTLHTANQVIPFFGLLMGFTSIGHSVWIFDGSANVFESGCREADVLIVDSARLPTLSTGWQGIAAKVMRNPQILIHDRANYQLRKP